MKKIILSILFINFCHIGFSQSKTDFYETNEKIDLFAFIGEKISIKEFDPNKNNGFREYDSVKKDSVLRTKYIIDRAFRVKYKIIKKIFNDLKTDTIEFLVYDRYGKPNFQKYKNVILYISTGSKVNYFHQKYQYDVVYKNSKDAWFGYIIDKNSRKKKVIDLETIFNNKRNNIFKELFE